jgi:NAD(P)-dependent dehydrogenase (short-subunit alcohol dehydrogenase family)
MAFEGRTAIVTGAAAGIGRAVALRLAASGARLALVDRDSGPLASVAGELADRRIEVLPLVADVADEGALVTAICEARTRFGRLDMLVNNAGIGIEKPLLDHELADFHRIFAVNLFGLFVALRETARIMIADGTDGRIVNLASVAGLRGSVGRAAYGPSKAAVINLTQTAAVELAPRGIRVNAVAPGPIETDLVRRMHRPETRAAWLRQVPQQRYGEADDVAAAVLWLLSDEARFVTGHVLVVDGGFAAAGMLYDISATAAAPVKEGEA